MRIQDRNLRRSLAQIAGIVLMTSWAGGLVDSVAFSSDDRGEIAAASNPASAIARNEGADTVPQADGPARLSRIGRSPETDSAAVATVANKDPDDAEISLLLDWHQDAINPTGARHPEGLPHSN